MLLPKKEYRVSIIKRKKLSNFTAIANAPFQRPDMSVEAKGMLVYLLTLPGDWRLNMRDLEKRHEGCKKDKTRRIMRELMDFGYVTREWKRDPETGQMQGWDYVVDDEPHLDEPAQEGLADSRKTRQSVNPTVGKPATTKETEKLNKQQTKRKDNVVSLREDDAPSTTEVPSLGLVDESPPAKGKGREDSVDFDEFFDAWNELAPNLPRVTERGRRGNVGTKKKIRALVREFGASEALSIFSDACREVNLDEFWQKKRYNVENMMRHVTLKADNWAARQSQPKGKRGKPHDGIDNDPLEAWFKGGGE